ncbi:MAG: two-component system, OmpR family, sensor histidine kinase KdpD, partial [Actinomycetota bacterium]|nr:two-component system, OmpR family, sensor histidine kinase KdpD [Actinomycetota bacterium]
MGKVHTGQVGTPRARRGELRIYLGAAPGVGKTFAMLGEGRRRRDRGTDVVVGWVETHGRARTAELLDGLEIVPPRRLTHRGVEFTELDADAVIARRPELALIDELAHTNVPGSANAKRWQDVDRILDAGIDVLSTVNVQHLESLNDVVERITGIHQQETIPDEIVRRAEQIELVDITPEALRRRMAHGNIYAANKIDAALGNYFRPGNLTALRELALLWVADQVDVAMQKYRADHLITDTWETRERVVVSITGGPESETLIRRARRMATRAGAELLVVHVLRSDGLAGVTPAALAAYRRLTEDMGGRFHQVVGDDVPRALLDFARAVNATQLVLGTSRRTRFARLLDEGIGSTVIQHSGPIDVHMVTHDESRRGRRLRFGASPLARSRRLLGWLFAIMLPAVVTGGGLLLSQSLNISTNVTGYVLATVAVALVGGLGPGVLSAVVGGLALNFFFVPPVHTFTIQSPEYVITLLTMVLVAVLVALVVDRAARRATYAAQARTEAALLASYARTVLSSPDPLTDLLAKVRQHFTASSAALLERGDPGWTVVAAAGEDPATEPDRAEVDVAVSPDLHLVLTGRALPAADRRVLEAAAGQAVLALRQQRMAAATADAQRRADATELRTALLSAVGHDLRTPLTSIKAAVGSLRDPCLRLSDSDTAELLETAEISADRLTGLIDNLLDSSRLATGAVAPQLRPVGYDEVVARALAGLDDGKAVEVDVDERLPRVLADVGLLERVVANLVDNALRHGKSTVDSLVAVRASSYRGTVELRVVDHGPGLPKGS